ncbi:Crp/Fnr family transcriptional regulator [Flavobacterium sp. ACN6]|uniref:Crp/Fnr family transcriptional regulator n=1 Tax=Flavobacterium sp. ACN6 TaxID=1920426 RepID=UPI000BB2D67B|nr:Crp/Fnr family transcriptional regulator [Flavobacterium sp. ACN6]PBJ07975.1 DNA-binding transcriptional dual regulator Crp [Flavobacterium sp. ACN6]
MEKIKAYFQTRLQLTAEYWELFSDSLEEKKYPKKSLLTTTGTTEKYLSFIDKGIVRLYNPGETDDLTFGFAFEGHFISAYDSFLTQTPYTYSIEALVNTKVWQICYDNLQRIYEISREGNFMGRLAGESLFLQKSRREISFLKDSAEQRYLQLFTQQPELIKFIPLKYIASYIGITHQALSRIRKRIT